MYLLHVKPIGSHGFEFDEKTRGLIGEGGLGTDGMRLRGKGLRTKKIDEAGEGGVMQDEGQPDGGKHDHVVDSSNSPRHLTSSGANGR